METALIIEISPGKNGCETFENRCRLVFEVIEAVTKIYGVGRVGCKIGPYVKMHGSQSTDTTEIFSYSELFKLYIPFFESMYLKL